VFGEKLFFSKQMIQGLKVTVITTIVTTIIDCIIEKILYFLIIDAEEFYEPNHNETNYTGPQDPKFIKLRDMLKEFLKNKNKRHKRNVNQKIFSRKLGGTRQKSHKSKPEKNINKSRNGKNMKSTLTK